MGQAVASKYPELAAGGFTRVDGTVQFYTRVRALLAELGPDPVVVDFGAGRGLGAESNVALHRSLCDLRGLAGRVVGLDVDAVVLENPLVHDAHVIDVGGRMPLADSSVDLVVADHTFEHVTEPQPAANELARILRPGGWLCARTPNKWGYIALAARLVPNRLHQRSLARLQPDRQSRDVFPTAYRLNTRAAVAAHFPPTEFDLVMYGWEPELAYGASSRFASSVASLLGRLTPERFRPTWHVFLQRRPVPPAVDAAGREAEVS